MANERLIADKDCEIHGNLCIVLSQVIEKFDSRKILDVASLADQIMSAYIKSLELYTRLNPGYVMQDAVMSVQGFCKKIGPSFEKYMGHFKPFLEWGLKNFEDISTCDVCTIMVGSTLWKEMGESFRLNHMEGLLAMLYDNLRNPAVDRKIKIRIIATFGDVALAIKWGFVPILRPVLEVVDKWSEVGFDDSNRNLDDWVDYVNELRDTVLETYQSILHGLHEGGKIADFPREHLASVIKLIGQIVNDYKNSVKQKKDGSPTSTLVDENVVKMCASTLSDLVAFFGREMWQGLGNAGYVGDLIQIVNHGRDQDTREAGVFLQDSLKKYGGGM